MRHTRAIVLAAGRGGRLLPETADRPKAVLSLGQETILEAQLRALRDFGVSEICVVTGHGAAKVQDILGDSVRYIHNERHADTNSLYSLSLASGFGRGGCLVLNSDVLFHPSMIGNLLESPANDALLIDFRTDLGEEEMKVVVHDGAIAEISKEIPPSRAHGENVGILKLCPSGAAAVFEIACGLPEEGQRRFMVPHSVASLASRRRFAAIPVGGLPWIEIDFHQDLRRAREEVYPVIREALDGAGKRGDPRQGSSKARAV